MFIPATFRYLISGSLLVCALIAGTKSVSPSAPNHRAAPRVYLWDAASLLETRAALGRGETSLQPALTKLRAEAERALKLRPPSVMDKSLRPASGDQHDYFSFGPYWWPDPTKANGLPYIRRDGDVNPTSRKNTDDTAFGHLSEAMQTLGLAYWFTTDERYAQKAAEMARVWFLIPATRMNPNLQHAQAIPGINDGRGIGIIESRHLTTIQDALALLGDSPAWTTADRAAMTAWIAEFYTWLTTSPHGLDEQGELNNHGTWYDMQAAHLALVLNRPAEAKKILATGLTRRLAYQISPTGAQPLELARTNSLNYSCFNLEALFSCAQLARHVGIDWHHYTSPDGRSLRAALTYLAPYVDPAKVWPKQDLLAADRSRLVPLLHVYLQQHTDPQLRELYTKFSATSPANARWRLLAHAPFIFSP